MINRFDSETHQLTLSEDGSYTAYSQEYEEHYHSTRDGALKESLLKHVYPAFSLYERDEVVILDICYGLGFNTLATLLYIKENALDIKVKIYSPELDAKLIASLKEFHYPKEFEEFREIIENLCDSGFYEDENLTIELFIGDAREYIKKFENHFDIVYQDAFSPKVNPILWTKEYFSDIAHAMKEDGVLTTYSIAFRTRLALYENGFNLYINRGEEYRDATIATKRELPGIEKVAMEHKIKCNEGVCSLRDADV